MEKISKRAIIGSVLRFGRSYFTDNVQIRFLLRDEKNEQVSSFVFVISSKIEKLAIKRNLIKRRGRAIIRENKSLVKPGFDCVFFFKNGSSSIAYKELKEQILFLLKKAKIIK